MLFAIQESRNQRAINCSEGFGSVSLYIWSQFALQTRCYSASQYRNTASPTSKWFSLLPSALLSWSGNRAEEDSIPSLFAAWCLPGTLCSCCSSVLLCHKPCSAKDLSAIGISFFSVPHVPWTAHAHLAVQPAKDSGSSGESLLPRLSPFSSRLFFLSEGCIATAF